MASWPWVYRRVCKKDKNKIYHFYSNGEVSGKLSWNQSNTKQVHRKRLVNFVIGINRMKKRNVLLYHLYHYDLFQCSGSPPLNRYSTKFSRSLYFLYPLLTLLQESWVFLNPEAFEILFGALISSYLFYLLCWTGKYSVKSFLYPFILISSLHLRMGWLSPQ